MGLLQGLLKEVRDKAPHLSNLPKRSLRSPTSWLAVCSTSKQMSKKNYAALNTIFPRFCRTFWQLLIEKRILTDCSKDILMRLQINLVRYFDVPSCCFSIKMIRIIYHFQQPLYVRFYTNFKFLRSLVSCWQQKQAFASFYPDFLLFVNYQIFCHVFLLQGLAQQFLTFVNLFLSAVILINLRILCGVDDSKPLMPCCWTSW